MATPRNLFARGASLFQRVHLEQTCRNPASLVRGRRVISSGTIVQDDSSSRSGSAKQTAATRISPSSNQTCYPILSASPQYTQFTRSRYCSGIDSYVGGSSSFFQSRRTLITNHHFNTNKIVSKLERSSFQRGQAEAIMRAMKAILNRHITRVRKNMLTNADLGNESYLFKAALTELRTELQILRKNDSAALAIKTEIISREIDSLNQKLREDIANLKHDIAIDMNSRKSDVREEQKALEIRNQSMSNNYMAQLGDVRTMMEAAKWETIRKGMMAIFVSATFVLLASRILLASEEEKSAVDYIDPYVSHSNAQNNSDGMVPDSFVVSHRT